MAFRMFVGKAMDNVVICVKTMADDIEILSVACIISAKDGIGDVVCDLNQPRGAGIDKKRRVSDVFENTPPRADLPEFALSFCSEVSRVVLSRTIIPRCASPDALRRPKNISKR
jgi:hypothetical protein